MCLVLSCTIGQDMTIKAQAALKFVMQIGHIPNTPVLIHSELGNSVDQKKKIKPAVSLVIILCDWCCQIWFDHFAYDNAVLHLISNFCLLILLTLQELHDLRRKNSALQMQQFVGEEKNDLLDYLRSLTPEKVCSKSNLMVNAKGQYFIMSHLRNLLFMIKCS